MPQRLQSLNEWLAGPVGLREFDIQPASGDASFRRYFRVTLPDGATHIAMDAPPDKEDSRPFVQLARRLREIGLNAPAIHHEDLANGFLLLDDFGTTHYLDALNGDTAERLYGDALSALMALQACGPVEGIPSYDEALLMREMELFRDWLAQKHLGLELSEREQRMLDDAFGALVSSAMEQPRVCVHRDYHSRNLLVTPSPSPGILDFQDAVLGPVTYDLVSLLRDCYIRWPLEQVETWARGYFELAVQSGVLRLEHEPRFIRWFDLMGIQRHLKAAGIFARLNHRDGKPGYLKDIPRTLGYICEVGPRYAEMEGLVAFIKGRVLPNL